MKNLVALLVGLFATSCVTSPLTDLERAEQDSLRFTNWVHCEQQLMQHGYVVYHYDHEHTRDGRILRMPTRLAIESDLWANQCRMVLGDMWME